MRPVLSARKSWRDVMVAVLEIAEKLAKAAAHAPLCDRNGAGSPQKKRIRLVCKVLAPVLRLTSDAGGGGQPQTPGGRRALAGYFSEADADGAGLPAVLAGAGAAGWLGLEVPLPFAPSAPFEGLELCLFA